MVHQVMSPHGPAQILLPATGTLELSVINVVNSFSSVFDVLDLTELSPKQNQRNEQIQNNKALKMALTNKLHEGSLSVISRLKIITP